MDWLDNKIFNKSEVARLVGMKRQDLENRIKKKYYYFTEDQIQKLKELKETIKNKILS